MPKILGKSGRVAIGGFVIPFREIEWDTSRLYQENTGSTNYDPVARVLWMTQRMTKISLTFRITGLYDTILISSDILTWLFRNPGRVPMTVFPGGTVLNASGQADVLDFRTTTPYDNLMGYSLTAKSNGPWTIT